MATVVPNRFNDPEYINWLKATSSLQCLRNSLLGFVEKETQAFHLSLQRKETLQGEICQTNCKPKQKEFPNPCDSCQKWKNEILQNHCNPKGEIYWNNTKPHLWHKEEWEVAKVFMPKGQTKHSKVSDFDISAVLNLMQNCKQFNSFIKKTMINKVISVRNNLMHSAEMKVMSQAMEDHINTIHNFINQLLSNPNLKTNSDLNTALEDIKKLPDMELNILLQGMETPLQGNTDLGAKNVFKLELQVLKEKIEMLTVQMEEDSHSRDHLQELLKLKDFFSNNKDLYESLGSQLETLDEMAKKIEEHDQQLAVLSDTVKDHEEDICNLDIRVMNLEENKETSGPLPPGKMYKNHLQDLARTREWLPPKFSEKYGPKGYTGLVTINGVEYEGKAEHKTKVASHQEVAKLALDALGQTSKELDSSYKPTETEAPEYFATVTASLKKTIETADAYESEQKATQMVYARLAGMLQLQDSSSEELHSQRIVEDFFSKSGYALPKQTNEKTDDKKYKCKLTILGEFSFQNKDGAGKKRQAEQEAAKTALSKLAGIFEWDSESIKVRSGNFKSRLQELLAQSGHNIPTYKAVQKDLSEKETTSPPALHGPSVIDQSSDDCRGTSEHSAVLAASQEAVDVSFEQPSDQPVGEPDAKRIRGAMPARVENQEAILRETSSAGSSAVDQSSSDCRATSEQSTILAALQKAMNVTSEQSSEQPVEEPDAKCIRENMPAQLEDQGAVIRETSSAANEFFAMVTVELKRTIETPEVYETKEKAIQAVYKKLASMFRLQDAKSDDAHSKEKVQDFFSKSGFNLPEESYAETSDNKFRCKLALSGEFSFRNQDSAPKKKVADHEAARTALAQLAGIFEWDPESMIVTKGNYKGKLQELLAKAAHRTPTYKEITKDQSGREKISPPTLQACPDSNEASVRTDILFPTTTESGSEIQEVSLVVDNTAQAGQVTETKIVSVALQSLMEKFKLGPPKVTFTCTSEVKVYLKDFKTETSEVYKTKKDATRAAYKSLGRALGILDETADIIMVTSKVKQFLSKKKYKLPEEICPGTCQPFTCQLAVTYSFSCQGKGVNQEQAQEEAAQEAILQLTSILGWNSNFIAVNGDGHKAQLLKLLQERGQEPPVYKDEFLGSSSIDFRNLVITSSKKWNNKKQAQKEVALRLLGLLGQPFPGDKFLAKNYAQEWFQREKLTVPKYEENGDGVQGFEGKATFSACVEYSITEPQPSIELANEKLKLEVQRHLEFIADKDIQQFLN